MPRAFLVFHARVWTRIQSKFLTERTIPRGSAAGFVHSHAGPYLAIEPLDIRLDPEELRKALEEARGMAEPLARVAR